MAVGRPADDAPVDIRRHPDFGDSEAPAPWANPADLVGHAAAQRRLAETIAAGRIGGTWLFGGRAGIGKATLAYRLAGVLLSEGGALPLGPVDSLRVDEADPAVIRIASRSHVDLRTVERGFGREGRKRTDVVVDDIRRLEPFFHQHAGEDGWRVAIIDDADFMNRNAANAALKLIEEPPRQSIVILVSEVPGRLLPTIRSRCRKLHLHPLETDQVALLLERHLPDLSEEDRVPLARLAGGSPGRALALASLGGLDLYRDIVGLLSEAPSIDPLALHDLADRLDRREAEPACRAVFEFLETWVARLVRGASGGGEQAPEPVLAGEAETMARLARGCDLERWADVWEKIARLRQGAIDGGMNLSRKQAVLAAFRAFEAAAKP